MTAKSSRKPLLLGDVMTNYPRGEAVGEQLFVFRPMSARRYNASRDTLRNENPFKSYGLLSVSAPLPLVHGYDPNSSTKERTEEEEDLPARFGPRVTSRQVTCVPVIQNTFCDITTTVTRHYITRACTYPVGGEGWYSSLCGEGNHHEPDLELIILYLYYPGCNLVSRGQPLKRKVYKTCPCTLQRERDSDEVVSAAICREATETSPLDAACADMSVLDSGRARGLGAVLSDLPVSRGNRCRVYVFLTTCVTCSKRVRLLSLVIPGSRQDEMAKSHKIMVTEPGQEFVAEFIEVYRSLPCLWRTKSRDYYNKALRSEGYKRLVDKWREVNPGADRDFVIKKINNLRSAFRREMNKVKASMRDRDPASDAVYSPHLWYYELLLFTADEEMPPTGGYHCEDGNLEEDHVWRAGDDILAAGVKVEIGEEIYGETVDSYPFSDQSAPPTSTKHSSTEPPPPQKKARPAESERNSSYCQTTSRTCESADECEIVGKRFEFQLRGMNERQRIIADKLISDVMYYGRLGRLSEDSVLHLRAPR
uniref:MADF domain-containing protein n=1 Tax=Timema douglasi TaxID=61478 RepID=A0A7R8VSD2_TIMDO|nr:unnamed protein product [Timema douglasi]